MSRKPTRQWQNAKEIADCVCHQGNVCGAGCQDFHHEGCAHDPNNTIVRGSEKAIERHIQLRRIEQEREVELSREHSESAEDRSSESSFAGLAWHVRQAKPIGNGWHCPSKGACSVM